MTNLEFLINEYNQNATRSKLMLTAHSIFDPESKYKNSLSIAQLSVKVLYTFQRTVGGKICVKEYNSRLRREMNKKGVIGV